MVEQLAALLVKYGEIRKGASNVYANHVSHMFHLIVQFGVLSSPDVSSPPHGFRGAQLAHKTPPLSAFSLMPRDADGIRGIGFAEMDR